MRGTERGDGGQERCFAVYSYDVSQWSCIVLMELLIVLFKTGKHTKRF
jgi:hypothetical protein